MGRRLAHALNCDRGTIKLEVVFAFCAKRTDEDGDKSVTICIKRGERAVLMSREDEATLQEPIEGLLMSREELNRSFTCAQELTLFSGEGSGVSRRVHKTLPDP